MSVESCRCCEVTRGVEITQLARLVQNPSRHRILARMYGLRTALAVYKSSSPQSMPRRVVQGMCPAEVSTLRASNRQMRYPAGACSCFRHCESRLRTTFGRKKKEVIPVSVWSLGILIASGTRNLSKSTCIPPPQEPPESQRVSSRSEAPPPMSNERSLVYIQMG